jgi:hypothetical protein
VLDCFDTESGTKFPLEVGWTSYYPPALSAEVASGQVRFAPAFARENGGLFLERHFYFYVAAGFRRIHGCKDLFSNELHHGPL